MSDTESEPLSDSLHNLIIGSEFTMSRKLSVTEAARNFLDVVNRVFYRGESMDLTKGGKVVARLVPSEASHAPTGLEVAEMWKSIPHLSTEEADSFAHDVESARDSLNQAPSAKWD